MTSTAKSATSLDVSAIVDGTEINASDVTTPINQASTAIDGAKETLSVSAGDANIKHLEDAITAGAGITVTKQNPAGDESLEIAIGAHTHVVADIDSEASTTGQVMTSDGAGNASWVTPAGGGGELGASSGLTISAGAITATGNHHTVDTEGASATDDLETINGLSDGDMCLIVAADASRTVVIKHGVGNIRLNGGVDFDLDNTEKGILFTQSGAYVIGVGVPVTGGGGGGGTVTSVGLALPAEFSITGSPVSSSGTLTGAWQSQSANEVLASPDGLAGTPAFRALVADDIPALPYAGTAHTHDASDINAGILDVARIPDLSADKVTSGVLNVARLPGITSTEIDSGVATNGHVLTADGAGNASWLASAGGGGVEVAQFAYRPASGASGDAFTTGAIRTATIDSTVVGQAWASILSNQLTLNTAGTYVIQIMVAINQATSLASIVGLATTAPAWVGKTISRYTGGPANQTYHTEIVTIGASTTYIAGVEVSSNATALAQGALLSTELYETYTLVTVWKVA